MKIDLSGKTALVGGSSQGLGAASALSLSKQGANIILLARNEANLKTVLESLTQSKNQQHSYIVANHSQPKDIKKLVEEHLKETNQEIDLLINNTGGPPPGPIAEMDSNDILNTVQMHLIAAHELVQLAIPSMKKNQFGRIINITSTSIKEPIPDLGLSNTVRAAVANWAKTLAMELATFGITVNNVLPGTIATGRIEQILKARADKASISYETALTNWMKTIPMGRFGTPQEIGDTIAFLASPSAAYITGINLPVDGGRTKSL